MIIAVNYLYFNQILSVSLMLEEIRFYALINLAHTHSKTVYTSLKAASYFFFAEK